MTVQTTPQPKPEGAENLVLASLMATSLVACVLGAVGGAILMLIWQGVF